jgi:hypothetical protein
MFEISRLYNRILFNLTVFLLNRVWDFTKSNNDIIKECKDRIQSASYILGNWKN